MIDITLNEALVEDILTHLDCKRKPATLRTLNQLISAYTRRVPWESVTRILKRNKMKSTADCPRWPQEFWLDALKYGTGGTCFESSLAFYSLLTSLGFQGYLTVNDMGTSRACHAAIIVLLKGRKYLVDVTIPVHSAVQIIPGRITRRRTSFHTYTIRPVSENLYQVERSAHSNRNAFTLIDRPVSEVDYLGVVTRDYQESGYFLKSVVIVKVIDDKVWRFNSAEKPFKLTGFNRNEKTIIVLAHNTMARTLAKKFMVPEEKVAGALHYVENISAVNYRLPAQAPVAGLPQAVGG